MDRSRPGIGSGDVEGWDRAVVEEVGCLGGGGARRDVVVEACEGACFAAAVDDKGVLARPTVVVVVVVHNGLGCGRLVVGRAGSSGVKLRSWLWPRR